ncbi:MAG: hypothetical protein ACLSE9_09410 [Acutalibacteraceae bacterium]
MTRTEEREQAFVLIFEKEFNMDTSMDDIISYAAEADVFSESAFCLFSCKGGIRKYRRR